MNETNMEGNTALHLALLEGRENCVPVLVMEAKVDLMAKNNQFLSPLALLNSDSCRTRMKRPSLADLDTETKKRLRQEFFSARPAFRTIVVHHPDCNLHIPRLNGSQGTNPWEAPPRIDAILKELKEQFQDWEVVYDTSCPLASKAEILRVHSQRYVSLLEHLNEEVKLSKRFDKQLMKDQSVAFTPHVQQGFGCPQDKIKDEGICDTSFSKVRGLEFV